MNKLKAIEAFIAVREEGGFSAAGRRLGLSTALVSKYVAALEQHLQIRLFTRSTRRVVPTDAGRLYHRRAAGLLAELEELDAEIRKEAESPRGRLRIAVPRVFGEDILAPALGQYMRRYPAVELELCFEERQVDIIAEGFDIALRMAALQDSSLIARKLFAIDYVVCASQEYLARSRVPTHPRDLEKVDCIINTRLAPDGRWHFCEAGRKFQVRPRPRARVDSARAAAALVRSGEGVGLCLGATVADDLKSGTLSPLYSDYQGYDRALYAVYPAGQHMSGRTRSFLDFLAEVFD